jgi:hypothetical protein
MGLFCVGQKSDSIWKFPRTAMACQCYNLLSPTGRATHNLQWIFLLHYMTTFIVNTTIISLLPYTTLSIFHSNLNPQEMVIISFVSENVELSEWVKRIKLLLFSCLVTWEQRSVELLVFDNPTKIGCMVCRFFQIMFLPPIQFQTSHLMNHERF